jgi:3-oxoadipate enol-lactonase
MHGYPFKDIVQVAVGDRKISVRIAGRGIPLMLLHGYPLDSRLWDRVVPLLCTKFLCVAPDLRGFGCSAEEPKSFSMANLADDCIKILDAMQIRQSINLCGLSMGGYVAMEVAQRYPERLSRLILTNTRANADDSVGMAARRSAAALALTDGVPKVVLSMLSKLLSQHTIANQPEVVELVRSMMLETRASTIAWAQLGMAARANFQYKMRDWTMPVVCIAGAEDQITPSEVLEQMSRELPNAEFHSVGNASHLTPLECPQEFAKIIS